MSIRGGIIEDPAPRPGEIREEKVDNKSVLVEYPLGYNGYSTRYTYKWAEWVGSYHGEWIQGVPNGKGIWEKEDGSRFEGYWKDGKWMGKGTYYWADGRKYEDHWYEDMMEGFYVYLS